jgi:hypothetical protein
VGNFFSPRAFLKKFWALWAILFKEQEQKFTFSHELHPALVEKATLRARQKALAGRIWPAGLTLPTPVLETNLAANQNFSLKKPQKHCIKNEKNMCDTLSTLPLPLRVSRVPKNQAQPIRRDFFIFFLLTNSEVFFKKVGPVLLVDQLLNLFVQKMVRKIRGDVNLMSLILVRIKFF